MRDVDGLRDSAEKARQAGGDRRMVVITPELAEQIADLADVVRVHVDRQCEPCPHEHLMQDALARLDGEDTG